MKKESSILGLIVPVVSLCLNLGFSTISFAQEGIVEEEVYDLTDTDGDTFPDVTEESLGTDPFDTNDFPGSDFEDEEVNGGEMDFKAFDGAVGKNVSSIPLSSCRSGYRNINNRFCIHTEVRSPSRFDVAMQRCRNVRARVATYGDLFYLYITTTFDHLYNPHEKWIGNIVGDNTVLFGNRPITSNNHPNIRDFEGTTNKTNSRQFWCAYDLN